MQAALLAAVAGLTTALGIMWTALSAKIRDAEAACTEDRKRLWELVAKVAQLDRRHDALASPPTN